MIWILDTKTLMQEYSKRPIELIGNTNYLLVSTRVRVTKQRDNVLNASNLFIESGMLKGVGFSDNNSPEAFSRFKSFLLKTPESLNLISRAIQCSILDDEDTIFICSPNEMDVGYLQTIAKVAEDIFKYPIRMYPEIDTYDEHDVLKRLVYYDDQIKELRLKKSKGKKRDSIISSMSKSELKRQLKKLGIYQKGMSKWEMQEELKEQ